MVSVFGFKWGSLLEADDPRERALGSAMWNPSTRKNKRRPLPGSARSGLIKEGCSWMPHS